MGSVVRFETSCTSRLLARCSLSYSCSSSFSNSSRVNVSPAFTPISSFSSAAVSDAPLCSHSHRMLKRISPVAMSSIRYSTSSLPKKSAGFSAAACSPCRNALPYWSATLSRSRAPRIGTRRVLEQDQAVSICAVVGERRELPTELILVANLLPHRPDDVDHFPVGDPLAAGAFALFALAAGDSALHRARDAGFRADRDVGLHAALPQRILTLRVRRVARRGARGPRRSACSRRSS